MDSRGRALVKLCQRQIPTAEDFGITDMTEHNSSVNCPEINVSNTEEDAPCFANLNANLLAEKEACDFLQKNGNVAVFASAPSSVVNPLVEIDTIIEPRSAPLPINQEASPLSLSNVDNNQDENALQTHRNIYENSSPVRGSPISGIELLPTTDEEPFSDSESSWIADSTEKINSGRRIKISQEQLDGSDCDDLLSPVKTRKRKIKRKKYSQKKFENDGSNYGQKRNISNNLQSDSSESDNNIIKTKRMRIRIRRKYTKTMTEKPNTDYEVANVSTNSRVSVPYKPDLTVDETDCESSTKEITEEQQSANSCNNHTIKSRWRKCFPTNWTREVERRKKSNCLPYKDKNGKTHEAKIPKISKCTALCRNKCSEKFTEEERLDMCKEYWEIRDFKQQKEYLLRRIIIKPVMRTLKNLPIEKQRTTSREYGFIKENKFIQVCKNFFMTTLSISSGPIETAVKNINERGSFSGIDKRGKRTPSNKTSEDRIKEVKTHIESFAVKDSHYCRKTTTRQYLDERLSISKMYELYKVKMIEMQKEPVKLNVYKKVFGTDYNLSFFHPKKDQCGLCNKYIRTPNPEEALKKEYGEHIERKEASFKSKDIDKKKSEEDPTFLCVTMDLQSLLQIPSTADSLMYYSRKLNLYNLSVYEFKPPSNNAHCLIWTEINGKRGSIEIASAINAWIRKIPEEVTHVTLYSDTCSGQNRNQYMCAYLLHLVQTSPKLCEIEQKYLESGHSFMEVDSMHSSIEKEKRYTNVYSVIDWKGIMSRARSTRHNKNVSPYNVMELTYKDMIDVKLLAGKIIKNRNICTDGNKVNWLKIKCLRFEKQFPSIIQFRYDYDGPYMSMDTSCSTGRATRRTVPQNIDIAQEIITKAYEHPLPITEAKKKDLINLCKKNIIPDELHAWYANLPSSNTTMEDLQSGNDSE